MDPMRFLTTKSDMVRFTMHAIAREAAEIEKVRFNNLAVEIADKVIRGMGGS